MKLVELRSDCCEFQKMSSILFCQKVWRPHAKKVINRHSEGSKTWNMSFQECAIHGCALKGNFSKKLKIQTIMKAWLGIMYTITIWLNEIN